MIKISEHYFIRHAKTDTCLKHDCEPKLDTCACFSQCSLCGELTPSEVEQMLSFILNKLK